MAMERTEAVITALFHFMDGPSAWSQGARRFFLLTLPVSGPAFILAVGAIILLVIAVVILCKPIIWACELWLKED